MKKSWVKIIAVLSIIFGFMLEVFYSYKRYELDGLPWQVSVGMGVAMSVLLMLCAAKNKLLLVGLVIFYQVITTSPGQTFSILEKTADIGVSESVEEYADQNEEIKKSISGIDLDINEARETIRKIPKDIETQARYRTTINNLKKNILELEEKKSDYQKNLTENVDEIVGTKKEFEKAANVYMFYGQMIVGKWLASEWIMFGLHTFLSVLISLMAPMGVKALLDAETAKSEHSSDATQPRAGNPPMRAFMEYPLSDWIALMWTGARMEPARMQIPTADSVAKWLNRHGYAFDDDIHTDRIRALQRLGLVTDSGKLTKPESEARSAMLILYNTSK